MYAKAKANAIPLKNSVLSEDQEEEEIFEDIGITIQGHEEICLIERKGVSIFRWSNYSPSRPATD